MPASLFLCLSPGAGKRQMTALLSTRQDIRGREKVREGYSPCQETRRSSMRRADPFFTGPSCSPGPGGRFRGQAAEKTPEHPFIGTWKTAGWRASLSLTGKKRLLRPLFLLLADGEKTEVLFLRKGHGTHCRSRNSFIRNRKSRFSVCHSFSAPPDRTPRLA